MTDPVRAITGLAALCLAASACVVVIDKDDDDGETGVSVGSIGDYDDEFETD